MVRWKDMPLGGKLIILFLLAGLLPLAITTLLGSSQSGRALSGVIESELKAIQQIKGEQLEGFFFEKLNDVSVYSENVSNVVAAQEFVDAWADGGASGTRWQRANDYYGGPFERYIEAFGYYDLFIISPEGRVVYTVTRESDFGEDLANGRLSNSGLAKAWSEGMTAPAFVDFAWYEPSNEAASFVSSPVKDKQGALVAVIAVQLSLEEINDILQSRTGLGETGNTYAVGPDYRMRSDAVFDSENHSVQASFHGNVEQNGLKNDPVQRALEGQQGVMRATDYLGREVISAYSSIDLPGGTKWAVLADMTVDEVQAPIRAIVRNSVIIGVVILALIVLAALLVARSISRPIKDVAGVAGRVAEGDLEAKTEVDSGDEVGQLGRSINDMVQSLRESREADQERMNQLNRAMDQVRGVADLHLQGDIEARADKDVTSGEYSALLEKFNEALDAVIDPVVEGIGIMNKYAEGDLSETMRELPGKQIVLTNALRKIQGNVQALVEEGTRLAGEAADGHLDTRGDEERFEGGYRRIIESFNTALARMAEPLTEARDIFDAMAGGDLTVRMKGDYRGDLLKMKQALNASLESLNSILGEVLNAVEQVNSGAQQVASASQSLSQGATEQASSLEEISSSMTEVQSQTRQNEENSMQASTLAGGANETARGGNDRMQRMLKAMDEINESSSEIQKIIKVIDEIAFQTNLLALNAAVEAARAGVHGKGFAVVAEEVRNLAQRSAKAARETTALIEGNVNSVKDGVQIADQTAKTLEEIVTAVTKANDLVNEITSASREQTVGVDQITEALGQVDQVTQSNTANAEQSAAAAEELSGQAANLREMVDRLQLSVARQSRAQGAPKVAQPARPAPRKLTDEGNGGGDTGKAPARRSTDAPKKRQPAPSQDPMIRLDDADFGDF